MDALAALGILVVFIAICAALSGGFGPYIQREIDLMKAKTWAPDDEAYANLIRKRQEAINKMRSKGIKTLYEGHPGWRTIRPMAVKPEPQKVTVLRRRPH